MKTRYELWLMLITLNTLVIAGEFNSRVAEKIRARDEQISKNKVRYIAVNTSSAKNKTVNFYYHVPKNYRDNAPHQYRGGDNDLWQATAMILRYWRKFL